MPLFKKSHCQPQAHICTQLCEWFSLELGTVAVLSGWAWGFKNLVAFFKNKEFSQKYSGI